MQQIPLVMPKLMSLEARAADTDRQRVDMAEADPVGLIEKTYFSVAERAKICGGTIADLLGLD